MCRLLGYCARSDVSVADLIGNRGLAEFTALSAMHSDGWGMAWYENGQPCVRKSPHRAEGEPEYDRLARRPLGGLGLVHLRWATPGLVVSESNSHPFRYGPYLLAHNGAIHPQARLDEMLPPTWQRQLRGTTDSEHYFLHLMWRLAEGDGDVMAAIAGTAMDIEEHFAPNSLNAILLSPTTLYAICWHDRAKVPHTELRERGLGDRPDDVAAYFDLGYRLTPDAVVVASSGWPRGDWTPLPNRHVLVADRTTLRTSIRALTPFPLPHGSGASPHHGP
jgi:predicted glutamine amidotransferase